MYTDDFVVAGTCGDNLYGVCETFYKPGLGPDDLFETLSQCLLAAVDRDAISGWGGVVHIMCAAAAARAVCGAPRTAGPPP